MLKTAVKESIFLGILADARRKFLIAALRARRIYRNSLVHKLGKKALRSVAAIFNAREAPLAVNDSILIGRGIKIYSRARKHIDRYAPTSKVIMMIKDVRNEIYFSPLRGLGLIMLAATFTNIAISLLLAKKSGPMAWFIRVNFLIIGVIWISCKVGLKKLKRTSLWLRMIKKR